jgi:non-homologous end joining protein Ku
VGTLLLLHVLHYPETVRAAARPTNGRSGVSAAELQLAAQLIDAASGAVDWSAYADQSAEELRSLVEAKIAGQTPAPAEPVAVVLPLMKALEQSVANLESAEASAPRTKERLPRKRGKRTA